MAATFSDAAATAAAAASAVATQDPALLSPPLSSSGSQVGTWTRTTPEPTSEGATAAPAQHLTAIASQEQVKEEPSGVKESLLLDRRSVREVNEKIFKCEQNKKKNGRRDVSEVPVKSFGALHQNFGALHRELSVRCRSIHTIPGTKYIL